MRYDSGLEEFLGLDQHLSRTIAAAIGGRGGRTLEVAAARRAAKILQDQD